jgi:hypothetical protein
MRIINDITTTGLIAAIIICTAPPAVHAETVENKHREEINQMRAQLEAKSAVIASNENTIEMQQMQKERLISTMLILDASLNVMCKKKQSFGCTQYRTIISEVMNETL